MSSLFYALPSLTLNFIVIMDEYNHVDVGKNPMPTNGESPIVDPK